jgi:hypothetical protein
MNIAKVKNSADFVNYVKPGLEMVEMEVEGAILGMSFDTNLDNPGDNWTPETENGGSLSGRSGRARVKR